MDLQTQVITAQLFDMVPESENWTEPTTSFCIKVDSSSGYTLIIRQ